MGQPATTNPWLIMLINMTIVFCVLYGLSLVIRLIKMIDPTKPKAAAPAAAVSVSAPAAAPAAQEDDAQLVAVIAAAIAAYGCSAGQIGFIRRVSGGEKWAQAGKMDAMGSRSAMY